MLGWNHLDVADCCEAAPATEPSGSAPVPLTDFSNEFEDRDHDGTPECVGSFFEGTRMTIRAMTESEAGDALRESKRT